MPNYDFLVLSPAEFENVSRDLLQKKLSLYLESFTEGRDGGIDLRSTTNSKNTLIVQAKRYKTYSSLKTNLKKELKKVKNLTPQRYILTTSVGLTPKRKNEILLLFSPFILSTEDIFGKDDLNNLLTINKDVEKEHYKLWLSSINVLEAVIKSRVYNQSKFEIEEIKEQLNLFVQNDSFNSALKILSKHKYLIISGIPGIGKTTLARLLALYYLKNTTNEFIFLNDSINDGYELFNEEASQLFLFDDFLGSNFLANNLQVNEDKKIIQFIKKISKTNNKYLIFTTREYILNQAKTNHELFKTENIEVAKCLLDLSSYTTLIKAQILYNHMYFANIPTKYIQEFIVKKCHIELINHANYSPRIIATIINNKIWLNCKVEDFPRILINYFDNPEGIWLHAFESCLDEISQSMLLVLLTMGTPVLIEDWEEACKSYFKSNKTISSGFSPMAFNTAVKELENTFIHTQADVSGQIIVKYHNPSIQDFLVNYVINKTEILTNLINSFIFTNQYFKIFSVKEKSKSKIFLNDRLSKTLKLNLLNITNFKASNIQGLILQVDNKWKRKRLSLYDFFYEILSEFDYEDSEIKQFIADKFIHFGSFNKAYGEFDELIYFLTRINVEDFPFNKIELISTCLDEISDIDQLSHFSEFSNIFPNTYKHLLKEGEINSKILELVNEAIMFASGQDIFETKEIVENLNLYFDIDLSDEISELEQLDSEYKDTLEDEDHDDETFIPNTDRLDSKGDTAIVNDMFKSLIS